MYFALNINLSQHPRGSQGGGLPFWRISLLLDMSKDTLRLVIDAILAGGHPSIALDLLFSTHITCL